MATNKKVVDETKFGDRITALEEALPAVDAARVSLEERVERLEAAARDTAATPQNADLGKDSMGIPRVV